MRDFNFLPRKFLGLKKLLRFFRNFFIVIMTVFLLFVAVWEFKYLVFETSYFELRKISIEGNVTISKDEIVSLSGFKLSESFFKLNYLKAEKMIRTHPKVANVDIVTEGLGEVLIRIYEREAVALVLYDKAFYELDSEGAIVSISNRNVRVDLPIITGVEMPVKKVGESIKPESKIKTVINWILNLEPAYITNISEVTLNGSEVVLITNDGIKIFPGNTLNFKNNFELLNIVLNKFKKDGMQISYVDMRFNNEVVVKPISN